MAADDSGEILLAIYKEIVVGSARWCLIKPAAMMFYLFHLLLWIKSLRENRDDPITTENVSISFLSWQKPKVYLE